MMARARSAPSVMTSKERNAAARGRFAFGVIPGRAQREPGIQWHLRDARLDPGSALRAVRDDIKKKGAPSGMMAREPQARNPGRAVSFRIDDV